MRIPLVVVAAVAIAGCTDEPSGPDFAAPVLDASVEALPPATVVASAQTLTNCLVTDGRSLYWTEEAPIGTIDAASDSLVEQVSVGGGTPTQIGAGADTPGCVVLDSTNVYFTGGGGDTIYKIPLAGGAQATVIAGQHVLPLRTPRVAAANGYVYWVTDVYGSVDAYNGMNALVRAPVGGGAVEIVFSDLKGEPGGLAVDASNAYYSDKTGMYVRALSGGAATAIGQSTIHVNHFAVDAHHLALAEVSGIGTGDVAVFALDGSGRTVVSMSLAAAFAIDTTGVYADDGGHLVRFGLDGKSATTLTDSGPRAIALDDTEVFFADGASILKIAK